MKKALLFLAAFVLLGAFASSVWAYDGRAVVPSGQTIYYNFYGDCISITGPSTFGWGDYTKPTGALVIPDSITHNGVKYPVVSIYWYSFCDCTGLTSVTIPNSVTSIGTTAFEGCSGLTSIVIPNSVTEIGYKAFEDCSGLTSITIGDSVTSIGNEAFKGCSALTSVIIPNSVTTIGNEAFYGCSSLNSLTIGSGVTSIANNAFRNCNGLNSIVVDAGNTVYDSRNNCNALIETAYSILIQGCNNTVIPNTVTEIGNYAFSDCSGLTSIAIPNSVISMGSYAFNNCSGLTSVTIGSGVTSIGDQVFRNCTSLTSVIFSNNVTSISDGAFYGCSGLTSVTIPNSVTSIGGCAFQNCSGLTSVTIPNSVTSIGEYAFRDCSGLTSVTIPNSVTTIGSEAFEGCSGLISVTIPSSITSIGYGIFLDCSGLISVTIPNSVTSIGGYAFGWCSSLTSVTIPNSVTSIDYCAFHSCTSLTSVTIPNTVTSIGYSAFENCSGLTAVTIGSGVTSIGRYAFQNCSSLDTVYMIPPTPPSLDNSYGEPFDSYTNLVFILTGCSYDNYYTTNSNNPWYDYRDKLRDPLYDINVTLLPNDSTRGTTSIIAGRSDRLVRCDSTAVISATANSDYHFDHWSTGSTANPDTITLAGDSTLTAYFVGLTVTSSDNSRGTASLTKIGDHIDEITATPNYGYHFDHWSNGSTSNPATIILMGDSTVTAYFEKNQYTLTMSVNDATMGTIVDRSGTYNYLDTVIVSATCTAEHHHFVCWSDWETANPRIVTITENTSLTAIFAIDTHYVGATPNNWEYGEVYGGGYYPYGSTVTLQAMPNEGHLFQGWSDFASDNPRTLTVEGDYFVNALFTPYCVPSICMVSVQDNHNLLIWDDNGVECDLNIYREGLTTGDYDLVATIPYGQGTQWVDEESRPMNRSYRYKMTAVDQYGNETPFSEVHKTMHLLISQGQGNSWMLSWTPYEGATYSSYQIYRGSNQYDIELIDQFSADGNTSYADYNVDLDTVYYQVAIIKDEPCYNAKSLNIIRSNIATNGTLGIDEWRDESGEWRVRVENGCIVVENLGNADALVRLYDMMGRSITTMNATTGRTSGVPSARLTTSALPGGVYLVKIGNAPAKKVVVVR